jgi:hypothetical protein
VSGSLVLLFTQDILRVGPCVACHRSALYMPRTCAGLLIGRLATPDAIGARSD